MAAVRTVLIVPPNDPEAVMILELARAVGLQVIRSAQPHGATLDAEPDIVPLVRDGGWKRAVIVEMPGPKTEERLRALGVDVTIIDHHRYPNLDRARDAKTAKLLPSSLEQFLRLMKLTPVRLKKLGFDPRLVRGVALMDRGFVWELMKAGYDAHEIERVLAYQRELMSTVRDQSGEERKDAAARKVWEKRKSWRGFLVIESGSDIGMRGRVSLLIALELGRPTPLILLEKKRGFIYVQESDYALRLFKKFGGFTFGGDRNWGHRNVRGKKAVGLKKVQSAIEDWASV